jgi:hypothetical protein
MDYEGEWGGGGPGHSWALKWHERPEPGSNYSNKGREEKKILLTYFATNFTKL